MSSINNPRHAHHNQEAVRPSESRSGGSLSANPPRSARLRRRSPANVEAAHDDFEDVPLSTIPPRQPTSTPPTRPPRPPRPLGHSPPRRPPENVVRARDHYYSKKNNGDKKPWLKNKITISAVVTSIIVGLAVTVIVVVQKSGKAGPSVSESSSITSTQSIEITTRIDASTETSIDHTAEAPGSFLDISRSGSPSMTTMTTSSSIPTTKPSSLSQLSHLASVFVDKGSKEKWRLLVWQDEAGDLVYSNWSSGPKPRRRIRDQLKDAAKPKEGTPLAATADDLGFVHLFYLSTSDTISHIYKDWKGKWKIGSLATDRKPINTHKKTMLSAAWHEGEKDTNVVVLSYQNPKGTLQLAMSENPKKDDRWHVVDFDSFTGRRLIGNWESLGHSLAGDWQSLREDPDGSFRGLLMAVEGDKEAAPWECSVDFHSSKREKRVECHWLDGTFSDKNGKIISLPSRASQFAWVRTGHGEDNGPASTLPYEFSFLYLGPGGSIEENRVAVGLPRIPGTGFDTDMTFDAISTASDGVLYARSGNNLVVFNLDADGWRWKMSGVFNTTVSE